MILSGSTTCVHTVIYQFHVVRSETQGPRLNGIPVSLHDALVRVITHTLQDVGDLMNHHTRQNFLQTESSLIRSQNMTM